MMKRAKIDTSDSCLTLNESEVPEGWEIKKMSEVTKKVPTLKPESEPDRIFGYVDISSINNETNQIFDFKKIRGEDAPSRAKQSIQFNDVLFSNVRTYLRNIAIVPDNLDVQVCSTGFTVLRSNGSIDPKFLFYYTLTDDFINGVTPQQTGSQYPATTDRVVKEATISFPKLDEQQCIVARVEARLMHVNAARDRLNRVPLIMKKFREAVLTAACSGRLTEGWREENPGVEPASILLKNDDSNRKKKKRAGRLWGAGIIPELTGEECDLLPISWTWTKVKEIGETPDETVQVGPMSMQSKTFSEKGVPVLNVGCVQWGYFDELKLNYMPEDLAKSFNRYKILKNDVLFTRSGTVGRCAIATDKQNGYLMTFHLLRVRPSVKKCLPEYLQFVFWGAPNIKRQTEAGVIGSTRAGFNTHLLANLNVPLPPLAEQHEIVRRVGLLFERADAIDHEVEAAGRRCERLTQAVLGKAFSGKL
jgi:type I restriction enzyme, S subunit